MPPSKRIKGSQIHLEIKGDMKIQKHGTSQPRNVYKRWSFALNSEFKVQNSYPEGVQQPSQNKTLLTRNTFICEAKEMQPSLHLLETPTNSKPFSSLNIVASPDFIQPLPIPEDMWSD